MSERIKGPLWEQEWRETEEKHMGRPEAIEPESYLPNIVVVRPNRVHRAANVALAHGVYINGLYRDHGIPRHPKEKPTFPLTGGVSFRRKHP